MNKNKIFFILSLLFIFLLLILTTQITPPKITGKITNIQYKGAYLLLSIENNSQEIIIFTNHLLKIKKQDNITIYGRTEKYQNKTQFIADKIIKNN